MELVPIKSLLSSAYMTYLGGENESSREINLSHWCSSLKSLLHGSEFNIRTFLATEA